MDELLFWQYSDKMAELNFVFENDEFFIPLKKNKIHNEP